MGGRLQRWGKRFSVCVGCLLWAVAADAGDCEHSLEISEKATESSVDEPEARLYVVVSEKIPESSKSAGADFNPVDGLLSTLSDNASGWKPQIVKSQALASTENGGYLITLAVEKLSVLRRTRGGVSWWVNQTLWNYALSKAVDKKWKKISAGKLRVVSNSNVAALVAGAVNSAGPLVLKVKSCSPLAGAKGKMKLVGTVTNNSSLVASDLYVNSSAGESCPFLPGIQYPLTEAVDKLLPGQSADFSLSVDARFDPDTTGFKLDRVSDITPQMRDWERSFISCAVWSKPDEKAKTAADATKTPKTEETKKEESTDEKPKKEEVKKEEDKEEVKKEEEGKKEEVKKEEAKIEW